MHCQPADDLTSIVKYWDIMIGTLTKYSAAMEIICKINGTQRCIIKCKSWDLMNSSMPCGYDTKTTYVLYVLFKIQVTHLVFDLNIWHLHKMWTDIKT